MRRIPWLLVAALLLCGLLLFVDRGNSTSPGGSASDQRQNPDRKTELPDTMKMGKSPRTSRKSQYELSPEFRNLVDMGVFSDRNSLPFFLIGMGGDIPSEALTAAGLGEAQRPELQRILGQLTDTMSSFTAARAVQDEVEAGRGNVVFDIPSDPQGEANALFEFRQSLIGSFDVKAADVLMRGLHCSQFFSSFGKQDVRLAVTEGPSHTGASVYYVEYACYDPVTGKKYSTGREVDESFKNRFGVGIGDKIFMAKETTDKRQPELFTL